MADNTAPKQLEPYAFKPGQSGNPAGRPRGARNRLSESFLGELLDDWEAHGKKAIADMRDKNPGDYVKMVAGLVPKEMTLNINNDADELSDDELRERIRALTSELTPFLVGAGDASSDADEARSAQQPPRVH